jgi:hypothetical protein
VRGAGTHALADVIAPNHEVSTIVGLAAHDDMDMRMFGIPVVNRDPVELCRKVSFRLPHQVSGKGFEVREPLRVIGRHYELEVVAIALASAGESAMIGVVAFCIEHPAWRTVPGDAVAAQIAEVRPERCSFSAVTHNAGLDHGTARSIGKPAHGRDASSAPPSEGSRPPGPA